jgi:integrase
LAYEEAPAALGAVRESTADTTTRLAFQYMVLTAARAGEVREADWSEIDIKARM